MELSPLGFLMPFDAISQRPLLAQMASRPHHATRSMGGLIARYACGRLFEPGTRTICGLTPRHYVSIASPHLGLTLQSGVAQAPMAQWASAVPGLQRLLSVAGHWVSKTIFRGTGIQFLALDGAAPLEEKEAQEEGRSQGAAAGVVTQGARKGDGRGSSSSGSTSSGTSAHAQPLILRLAMDDTSG